MLTFVPLSEGTSEIQIHYSLVIHKRKVPSPLDTKLQSAPSPS